ncbi:MAG TPA: menaquinone biosynthesis decarboxylase, partial [Spirochaetota bacterium]|nr:menaquinone biosynthesis decarboxylase [Spirochaetota bacterium]
MKKNYKDLHEFISHLEMEGQLLRIKDPVSNILEITEITDRMSKMPGGGKALLFENVKGYNFPVITNQFGSIRRINMALGSSSLDELAGRLHSIINMKPPVTLMDKIKLLPELLSMSRFLPRVRKGVAPCQEVILTGDEVDLTKLPVLFCWPGDGGPFITLPVVFTRSLSDGKRNAGMYRMQIFDKRTTGMHWHIHKDGAHHYHEYKKAGKRMEVAVAVGTDPAVTYAATAPLPRGVDEMLLAGFIRRKPVEMVKCVTVDLEVPANAEFILEGYVDPDELKVEGPFGDHTGYYSLKGEYPVFHVTAITHKKKAIYSATIVGKPPMEDCYMALATERLFLQMIKTILPEIKDYMLPWEGVFHNIAVVAI